MSNKVMMLVLGLGLAIALTGLMAGCASSGSCCGGSSVGDLCGPCGSTMVEDPQEHYRRLCRNACLERRELAEDIDYLCLTDEPSHLTPYYMPRKPH